MLLRIDKNASTDAVKIASVTYLSKRKGVITQTVRINNSDTVPEGQQYDNTIESIPQDAGVAITRLFDKDNNLASHPIYQGLYLDKLSVKILSEYSEDAQLCVLTDKGFYKSFSIGGKTGEFEIDVLEGETVPEDESVTQFETSTGFIAGKTNNGFKPQFFNFDSYQNPTYFYLKIVGNDKTSASSIVKCNLECV